MNQTHVSLLVPLHTCQDEDEDNKTESGSEDDEDAPEDKQVKKTLKETKSKTKKKTSNSKDGTSRQWLRICAHAFINMSICFEIMCHTTKYMCP